MFFRTVRLKTLSSYSSGVILVNLDPRSPIPAMRPFLSNIKAYMPFLSVVNERASLPKQILKDVIRNLYVFLTTSFISSIAK